VVYTILLKWRTWLHVLFGGVAGNAAFLTGYVSARPPDTVGVLLSLVVYLWIPAHIWSFSYARREDYLRAGVSMLSVILTSPGARAVSISNKSQISL